MGALHDGHVSLVRLASAAHAERSSLSIFVNPTQFAPTEDFGSYPRTWKADVAKLAEAEKRRPDLESRRQGDVPRRLRHQDRAGRSGHRRPARIASGRISSAASPPWSASCSRRCGRMWRSSARRTSSSWWSTRMARDLDLGVRVIGSRHRARARRPRDVLAQRLPLARRNARRRRCLYRAMKESAKRLKAGDDAGGRHGRWRRE